MQQMLMGLYGVTWKEALYVKYNIIKKQHDSSIF